METLETMIRSMAREIVNQEVLAVVKSTHLRLAILPESEAGLPAEPLVPAPRVTPPPAAPVEVAAPKLTPPERRSSKAARATGKRGPGRPRKNPLPERDEKIPFRGEVSVTTAAKWVGIAPGTVYDAVKTKALPAKFVKGAGRSGKRVILQASDVREWVKSLK